MVEQTNNTLRTPIAVFIYNRPEHAQSLFQSLSACHRLAECSLHIFCDGPKADADIPAVSAARDVARDWADRLKGKVVERESNLGLARSIVRGVTDLCDSYGRVIVLEDDFVLDPSFCDYMLTTLDRYADEPRVYQVSGYMFPVKHEAQPDAFFLPLTTTWGWATWSRAWKSIDWNATDALEKLRDPALRRKFDLDGSYPYSLMLERRLQNQNDSWGILFWWSVFKAGGLGLHPRESLVTVGGFDGTGTHCGDQSWTVFESYERIPTASLAQFKFPNEVQPDDVAFDKITRFLRAQQYPQSWRGRVWRKVEQLLPVGRR